MIFLTVLIYQNPEKSQYAVKIGGVTRIQISEFYRIKNSLEIFIFARFYVLKESTVT